MTELIYKDEVYDIVGAAMEVHSIIGPGFLEAVYQETLAIELRLRNIPFTEQPRYAWSTKGTGWSANMCPTIFATKK